VERIICLAIGYLFGLFQTAYLYGKLHGIDIRQHGSGNAGTTNTLRVLGTKAGLIVFAGDVLKCIFAVVICSLLFGKSHPDMIYLYKMYAAAGAILGHNFPFYLKFKGGMFFGAFLLTHYVSLGSLLVYAAFIIQIILSGQLGLFHGMTQAALAEMYIIAGFLTVMAYYKHRENIKRLLKGEERKTYLFKKKDS